MVFFSGLSFLHWRFFVVFFSSLGFLSWRFFVVLFSGLSFLGWRFFVVLGFLVVRCFSWRFFSSSRWRSGSGGRSWRGGGSRSSSCSISSESNRRQTHSGSNDQR